MFHFGRFLFEAKGTHPSKSSKTLHCWTFQCKQYVRPDVNEAVHWQTGKNESTKETGRRQSQKFENSKIEKRICQKIYCALGNLRNWLFCRKSLGQCWRWHGETLFNFRQILKVSETNIFERILAKSHFIIWDSPPYLWWYLKWWNGVA